MLYLSLTAVGQSFLSFQWDLLLLETGTPPPPPSPPRRIAVPPLTRSYPSPGLAALILAPWLPQRGGGTRAPRLGVWVLRALLFKVGRG